MNLIAELQANVRLRLGAALIVAIFAAYGLLEWRDSREVRLAQYREQTSRLLRLENQQSQAHWQDRALEAQTALKGAERRLWQDESAGLAQAQFQDWLYALLREVKAKSFAVKLTDSETLFEKAKASEAQQDLLLDLKPLRARIEFGSDSQQLLALLAAFNDAKHQVIVDKLNVKPFKTEIELTAWFQIVPSVAAEAASGVGAK
ncbi:hypothetical protein DAPPUDRAFT_346731 [Daphnia pulex]|uniref:Uncharacterized protein n=1 Tax=Daphnia pulex TaxID=6669 RepID=E9I816_DAPPU|nr:hypothetical protein DAPPUDRAFT_346731 [Daphnia pulex]|eukprot:EFX59864.1 hypothetical protein DAPPUDRAFT_346731 [Daphnia pulex]